jgi:serine protease Do
VILAVNGSPVADSTSLPAQIASLKPGSQADLQIWRDKSKKSISVTLGAMTDAKLASNDGGPVEQGRLGVAVRPLTPQERSATNLSHGLMVQQAGGPAASAGIQPGDVILAVNGRPVTNPEQLRDAVKERATVLLC